MTSAEQEQAFRRTISVSLLEWQCKTYAQSVGKQISKGRESMPGGRLPRGCEVSDREEQRDDREGDPRKDSEAVHES